MHAVGVIPHDDKVLRSRFKRSQPRNGFIAVNDALRVGIFGDAPDALHGGVLHIFFDKIHIRAGGCHWYVEHLHTKGLADCKMPVIARNGAKELYFAEFAPGCGGMQKAMRKRLGNKAVHQGQAGTASCENLLGLHAEEFRKKRAAGGQAVHRAIVARIDSSAYVRIRCGKGEQGI